MKDIDWIGVLQQIGKLSPDLREKAFQILGLVAELSANPLAQPLIDALRGAKGPGTA